MPPWTFVKNGMGGIRMKRLVQFSLLAAVAAGLAIQAASAEKPDEKAKLDRLLVKAQKICPVMGIKLGEHGTPIKARIGKVDLFLCCKGCLRRKISRENWTKVKGHLAEAQKICPVMKKPLPEKPQHVMVKQRIVFVCCKPCIEKVQADPEKYLAVINAQLKKNAAEKIASEK